MARENKIKGLVTGYCGKQPQQEQTKAKERPTVAQRRDLTADEVEQFQISPKMQESLNNLRRLKVGRPLGSRTGHAKGRGFRATFIISNPLLLRELKYIALADTKLYKDIINEALTSYVEKWKKNNGEIQISQTNKD